LPQFGQITIRESSARSMYRGASFGARYNASSRIQFGIQYTVAQSYSDDDNERTATCCNYDSPANFKAEYGYAALDIRNQFASYAIYKLPYGFHLSGNFSASSGQPIDPMVGSDVNGDSATSDRSFKAVGVEFPRDYFRNLGFKTVNLRIMKDFKLGEKYKVQLSAEMFNLFNFKNVVVGLPGALTTNYIYGLGVDASGNTVAPNAAFMRVQLPNGLYDANNFQIGTPFQAQFGVRFMF